MSDEQMMLPEVNQAELDDSGVEMLFRDIGACTRVREVSVKRGERRMVESQKRVTLEEARDLLRARTVRGAQVRYEYQGEEWWDTLIVSAHGVRVVRVRAPR